MTPLNCPKEVLKPSLDIPKGDRNLPVGHLEYKIKNNLCHAKLFKKKSGL